MKKYFPLLLVALAVFLGVDHFVPTGGVVTGRAPATPTAQNSNSSIAQAYRERAHDVPVRGRGTVIKVLPDDTRGSQHQRFLLNVGSDQTILVAHNIDLAPRVAHLRKGDTVGFNGIYEYNDKGGVIHWTHRDPDSRHPDGWLELDGKRYQ